MFRAERAVGGSAAPAILDDSPDGERLDVAALSTISAIQDVFAEELAEPWPASAGEMPAPDVRVAGGVLLAWFGPRERPDLALTPFELPTG